MADFLYTQAELLLAVLVVVNDAPGITLADLEARTSFTRREIRYAVDALIHRGLAWEDTRGDAPAVYPRLAKQAREEHAE